MNPIIPSLNHAGDVLLRFAAPMALQCAVLVAVLALLDFALKNRVRAAFRYGLWLLLLVKLVLPPTLSSPTSAAYWLPAERKQARPAPPVLTTRVEFTDIPNSYVATPDLAPALPPHPRLRAPAVLLLLWASGVVALSLWLVRRAFFVAGLVRRAQAAQASLQTLLHGCRALFPEPRSSRGDETQTSPDKKIRVSLPRLLRCIGAVRGRTFCFGRRAELRLSPDVAAPAVCGLWRPVILLPAEMAGELSDAQLRPVLLHELVHIRRGDLWVNHAQCLLQILYWWHPLVWLGNAALRRAREQAVDEQVMVALGRDADDYPATLLEIAKAAIPRPGLALGLVGILEHRRALKTRIRRLLERPLPSGATLGPRHLLIILLVALAALPMNAARDNGRELAALSSAQGKENAWNSASPAVGPKNVAPTKSIGDSTRSVPSEAPALYTRWYKVDPNAFATTISEMLEGKSSNKPAGRAAIDFTTGNPDRAVLVTSLTKLLSRLGVEISPPKSVIFNERLGMLMVRAPQADLDVVEQFIQVANAVPAQVLIEAKFVEVIQGDAAATGLSALLGFDIAAKNGATPGAAQPPNARLASGLMPTNLPPPVFTGIFTPPQYRVVLAALEKRQGAEILAVPTVLTPSGRQAQIKVVEVRTIVTDLGFDPTAGVGSIQPITEPFELGPSLDVVPNVQPDGYTIQMTLLPTFKEFVGYDLTGSQKFGAATGITNSIPLPIFRLRQAITSASVLDGQTVVLGLGAAEVESKAGGAKVRKNLLVFITPTIVDPAGNRVHTEEAMPSPKDRVPPQKSK